MPAIVTPHLPENNVTCVILSCLAVKVIDALTTLGVVAIPVPAHPLLQEPIATHADLQFFHMGGEDIIVCRGADPVNQAFLRKKGFHLIEASGALRPEYPGDAALDAARVGNVLIYHPSCTDAAVLSQITSAGLKPIATRQGYVKCSVCIVDDHSLITSDQGIARRTSKAGLDVLQINPGFVELDGYRYGFIGACCGKLAPDLIAFTGDLETHPDCQNIRNFLSGRGVRDIALCHGPLRDIGGILPLTET